MREQRLRDARRCRGRRSRSSRRRTGVDAVTLRLLRREEADERLRGRRVSPCPSTGLYDPATRRVEASCPSDEPDADGCVVRVTPESAGWRYVGSRCTGSSLERGSRASTRSRDLRRRPVGTRSSRRRRPEWRHAGERRTVFDGPPTALYVPPRHALVGRSGPGGGGRRLHRAGRDAAPSSGCSPRRHAPRVARQRRRGARDRPHPDGGRACGVAARHRGRDAGRPLVELSAAQARRRRSAATSATWRRRTTTASGPRTASPSSASTPPTARSTRRSRSKTATSCSFRAAITRSPRAPPRPLLPERDGRADARVARDRRSRLHLDASSVLDLVADGMSSAQPSREQRVPRPRSRSASFSRDPSRRGGRGRARRRRHLPRRAR